MSCALAVKGASVSSKQSKPAGKAAGTAAWAVGEATGTVVLQWVNMSANIKMGFFIN
jgi:hypothetical protein